jgi:hypothetical protein
VKEREINRENEGRERGRGRVGSRRRERVYALVHFLGREFGGGRDLGADVFAGACSRHKIRAATVAVGRCRYKLESKSKMEAAAAKKARQNSLCLCILQAVKEGRCKGQVS